MIVMGQLTIAAILGILITVWLNHLLANTRDAKNRKATLNLKTIDVFSPELDALIHTGGDAGHILTTESFKRHESAIRNLLPHLSWVQRYRLRRAWHQLAYHEKDKKGQLAFYVQYADCGSITDRQRMKPLAVQRIQKVISLLME